MERRQINRSGTTVTGKILIKYVPVVNNAPDGIK